MEGSYQPVRHIEILLIVLAKLSIFSLFLVHKRAIVTESLISSLSI